MASSSRNFGSSSSEKLHFIMIPLMAQGHLIPMVDMGKLIAKQGQTVTIITTPFNAARIRRNLARFKHIHGDLPIDICEVPFPDTKGSCIAEGCENLDMLTGVEAHLDFYRVTCKLENAIELQLRCMEHEPSCIISDMMFPWTNDLARKFRIPRIVFDGTGCFSLMCFHSLVTNRFLDTIPTDNTPFEIPNLPDRIMTIKVKQPKSLDPRYKGLYAARQEMIKGLNGSFGVVVNSFIELERKYYRSYKQALGKSVWSVGPVSSVNETMIDVGDRGREAAVAYEACYHWLNRNGDKTVVYASLGSLCNLDARQLMEIALGLEASECPYILTIRDGPNKEELRRLLQADGYEQRTSGRCVIIWGWAPQMMILQHSAVGGFLTHCGWNSSLESLSFGVPLITCPMFFDQFNNEEYFVRVLRVGTKVSFPSREPEQEVEIFRVNREGVKRAIKLVMVRSGEALAMRERARRLSVLAKEAMSIDGSSFKEMTSMIDEVEQYLRRRA